MHIDGSCHCGHIAYEAEADPEQVGMCHCTDCQKFSGSAFRIGVPVPEASFRLNSGTLKTYIKTAESGGRRAQVFCPECGTHIYSTTAEEEGNRLFRIRVPTANQAAQLPPKRRGWCSSAPAWLGSIDALPQRPKQ
jgi:hypothetical protein